MASIRDDGVPCLRPPARLCGRRLPWTVRGDTYHECLRLPHDGGDHECRCGVRFAAGPAAGLHVRSAHRHFLRAASTRAS